MLVQQRNEFRHLSQQWKLCIVGRQTATEHRRNRADSLWTVPMHTYDEDLCEDHAKVSSILAGITFHAIRHPQW